MFGVDFSNAWSAAKESAKEAVSKIIEESKEKIEKAANDIKEKASDLKEKSKQKLSEAKEYVDEKTTEVKEYVEEKVEQFIEVAEQTATSIAEKAKKAFNKAVDIFSGLAGFAFVTCPKKIANTIYDKVYEVMDGGDIDKDWDGKFLPNCNECSPSGFDCKATKGSSIEPSPGKKPTSGCDKKTLPPIYFINGINSTPQQNCESSKAISNATCSEVVGVYNRTQGTVRDVLECLGNIFQSHPFGGSTPTNAMSKLITNAIMKDPPKEIAIYAHSQGGLVTRESIAHVRADLEKKGMEPEEIEERMSKINIKSFGTAQNDWPKGPNYEQYTHPNDGIPKAIAVADSMKRVMIGPTKDQFADIPESNKHIVTTKKNEKTGEEFSKWNPIGSHNMVNSYVPELVKQRKDSNEIKCATCSHSKNN